MDRPVQPGERLMMLERSLQSAELECANWRALAAQHALANDLGLLTQARAQLSNCQAHRDALAAQLLAEEGSKIASSAL